MTDARPDSHSMSNFQFCPRCGAPLTPEHPGDDPGRAPRQACSRRCGFVHYDNPCGGGRGGTTQVLRQEQAGGPWYALGRILERDETPEDAVLGVGGSGMEALAR